MDLRSERQAPAVGLPPVPFTGSTTRGRVLFVHPDRDLGDVVVRVLHREGYVVEAVPHSGHALLRCRGAAFDVLIAELSGPDMSGPSLADLIRRHCPNLRTLYIGRPGALDRVDNLLVPPFTRDELVERLHAATASVTVRTPATA